MAKVTGFTATRMLQIEKSSVVSGAIEGEDELVLYTRGGDRIRAGSIKGGTAEWIREYKPIVDDHTEILDRTADELADIHEDLVEANEFIDSARDAINIDIPEAKQKAQSAHDNALLALQKADDTVKELTMEYAVGSSRTVPPTTGWSENVPIRDEEEYIWFRSRILRNDGNPAIYTSAALLTGDKGNPGDKGGKGDQGDQGDQGDEGPQGVGVESITRYWRRVDTDTIVSGPEVGGGYFAGGYGSIFEVTESVVIIGGTVISETAGTKQFIIQDRTSDPNNYDTLMFVDVPVVAGEQYIRLDFALDPGTYWLGVPSNGPQLIRQDEDVTYPYESGTFTWTSRAAIEGGANTNSFYYAPFNLVVKGVGLEGTAHSTAPEMPTGNLNETPEPEWTTTEPDYEPDTALYSTDLVVYDNGYYVYLPISKSSSYEAAKSAASEAMYVANLAEQKAAGLIRYMNSDDFQDALNDGLEGTSGDIIMVVDDVETDGETISNITAIYQWDGFDWGRYTLVTDTMIVAGPDGGTYIQNGDVYSKRLMGEIIDGELVQARTLAGEKMILGSLKKDTLDPDVQNVLDDSEDWNQVTIVENGRILLAANAPRDMDWNSTVNNAAVSAMTLEATSGNVDLNMYVGGQKVAYIDGVKSQMGIKRAVVEETIVLGEHQITSMDGGITVFNWVGKTGG